MALFAMSLGEPVPQADIGSLIVINNCPQPVYYHVKDSETKQISTRGFHTPYDTTISVKFFHNPAEIQGSSSQLELDLDRDAGRIWYNISNDHAFGTGLPL